MPLQMRIIETGRVPASRKSNETVPLLDCYTAPCQDGCPIHQEIPTYVALAGEGKYEEALKVILNRKYTAIYDWYYLSHPVRVIVHVISMRNPYRSEIQNWNVLSRLWMLL